MGRFCKVGRRTFCRATVCLWEIHAPSEHCVCTNKLWTMLFSFLFAVMCILGTSALQLCRIALFFGIVAALFCFLSNAFCAIQTERACFWVRLCQNTRSEALHISDFVSFTLLLRATLSQRWWRLQRGEGSSYVMRTVIAQKVWLGIAHGDDIVENLACSYKNA